MREAPSCGGIQFDSIIQTCGVALPFADYGENFFDVVAKERRAEMVLARAHLIQISPQRVYFAVVGKVAERLSQLPSRESVGAVPLVNESNCAFKILVGKIREELAQLRSI